MVCRWRSTEQERTPCSIGHAAEYKRTKERLNRILFNHTGRSLEQIERDTDRDKFMSAEEALEYHLIDKVITSLAPTKAVG